MQPHGIRMARPRRGALQVGALRQARAAGGQAEQRGGALLQGDEGTKSTAMGNPGFCFNHGCLGGA